MSRPRGDVRQALAMAAAALHEAQGGATWREIAERACVGFRAARMTVENMHRAGELVCIGQRLRPGSRRPMLVLAPRDAIEGTRTTPEAMGALLRAWHPLPAGSE